MPVRQKTSMTMLEGLRNGKNTQWDIFYNDYKRFIEMVFVKATGLKDKDNKDEITQRVMIAVFNNGRFSFDPKRKIKFHTWLSTVIRNKTNDILRERYRKTNNETSLGRLPSDSKDNSKPHEIEVSKDTFKEIFDEEHATLLRRQCLKELKKDVDEKTYKVFELLTIEKMKAEEVSKIMGMTVESVYTDKSRCAKKCREYRTLLENPF